MSRNTVERLLGLSEPPRYVRRPTSSQLDPFTERIAAYHGIVSRLDQPWVRAVPQQRVASHAALMARLDRMVKDGGEGLMLHRGDSLYAGTRSDDLLKLKLHEDAEAHPAVRWLP